MRVWDVSPGYLNKDSLLGEHREIHALLVVLEQGKRGYTNHPETRRWRGHEAGLAVRHEVVAAEMRLRGYVDRTPVATAAGGSSGDAAVALHPDWPERYLDTPGEQFLMLERRYRELGRGGGRIPFPGNRQELWAQHKYSVMARSQETYRSLGRTVSGLGEEGSLESLAEELVGLLRRVPPQGGVRNVAAHVWGYVSSFADPGTSRRGVTLLDSDPLESLALTFCLAAEHEVTYLLHSTIFSDVPGSTRTAAG